MQQTRPLPKKPNSITDYGVEFQQQLIAEIITNSRFADEIIDIIKPEYFKNAYFNLIIKLIKEYHTKHEVIPNYVALRIDIDDMYGSNPSQHKIILDTLKGVEACPMNSLNVQEIALKFCKFQNVRNAIDTVKGKLDKGGYEQYDEIEELIRKAITFRERDEGVPVHINLEKALEDDYRAPIPTGIAGLDEITNGGLGKKELAVIIAPLGVGKTTLLSLIGSNAYLNNKNVLHIFFEDKLDEVRRKYLCHWSGIALPELNDNKKTVLRKAKEIIDARPNVHLVFEKLPADETNIFKLRRIIKREKNKMGGKLDVIIIDYADCIVGEQGKQVEEWQGEGRTMRQLETFADDFDSAVWTAVQGGRKSTTASVVEVDMIGGNIKKAQVGHLIISVAKTLPQREQKLATIAVLKSRFGDDGKVFENCPFDNSKMLVDTSKQQTLGDFATEQTSKLLDRVRTINQGLRKTDKYNKESEKNNQNGEE